MRAEGRWFRCVYLRVVRWAGPTDLRYIRVAADTFDYPTPGLALDNATFPESPVSLAAGDAGIVPLLPDREPLDLNAPPFVDPPADPDDTPFHTPRPILDHVQELGGEG